MKACVFCFFLPVFLFCQSNRFVYEYKSIKDINKIKDTTKSIMYLDVYKEGSVFYDIQNYKNDSIASLQGYKLSLFVDRVYKEYPQKVFLITSINNDFYSVSDVKNLNWNISSEKKEINKINAQKATVNFGGRVWEAWFSTDIPLSDGPYKFHGLPGLIIKITDSTLTHTFQLISTQKIKGTLSKKINNVKLYPIDQKQYKKLYKEYRENPNKNFQGMDIFETQDGKSSSEFKKNMERYYKNKIKKENNIIEIDLLDD
jgi:GLPGLI family protein